jgi:hypothetical protein
MEQFHHLGLVLAGFNGPRWIRERWGFVLAGFGGGHTRAWCSGSFRPGWTTASVHLGGSGGPVYWSKSCATETKLLLLSLPLIYAVYWGIWSWEHLFPTQMKWISIFIQTFKSNGYVDGYDSIQRYRSLFFLLRLTWESVELESEGGESF